MAIRAPRDALVSFDHSCYGTVNLPLGRAWNLWRIPRLQRVSSADMGILYRLLSCVTIGPSFVNHVAKGSDLTSQEASGVA